MGRNRPLPSFPRWRVTTNPIGHWIVTDESGREPLRHPDRVERLRAVYVAAQAPPLLMAVEELVHTVEYLRGPFHSYAPLLEFAYLTISLAKPPYEMERSIEPLRHQGELDLEAA